jgi:hypothetical protein
VRGNLDVSNTVGSYLYLDVGGAIANFGRLVVNLVTAQGDVRNEGVWPSSTRLNGTAPRAITGAVPLGGFVELVTDVDLSAGQDVILLGAVTVQHLTLPTHRFCIIILTILF